MGGCVKNEWWDMFFAIMCGTLSLSPFWRKQVAVSLASIPCPSRLTLTKEVHIIQRRLPPSSGWGDALYACQAPLWNNLAVCSIVDIPALLRAPSSPVSPLQPISMLQSLYKLYMFLYIPCLDLENLLVFNRNQFN